MASYSTSRSLTSLSFQIYKRNVLRIEIKFPTFEISLRLILLSDDLSPLILRSNFSCKRSLCQNCKNKNHCKNASQQDCQFDTHSPSFSQSPSHEKKIFLFLLPSEGSKGLPGNPHTLGEPEPSSSPLLINHLLRKKPPFLLLPQNKVHLQKLLRRKTQNPQGLYPPLVDDQREQSLGF